MKGEGWLKGAWIKLGGKESRGVTASLARAVSSSSSSSSSMSPVGKGIGEWGGG